MRLRSLRCNRRVQRLPIAAPACLVTGYPRLQHRNPDPAARIAGEAYGEDRRQLPPSTRAADTCGTALRPLSGACEGLNAAPRLVNSVAES